MAGSNLRQPLFWCQALHVLHSSSHLTGVCTGTDYVDHSSTGLTGVALLLACFSVHYYKLAHVLQNVQRTVTAFLPSHKQAQADANPSGLVSKVCSEKAAADVCCAHCHRTAAARMAYALSVSMCCTP